MQEFNKCENFREYISYKIFSGCSSLTSVEIPESVNIIGERAFEDCENFKDAEVPGSIEEIGIYAFSGCRSLTSVRIPKGLTKLSLYAFANCDSLMSILVEEGNRNYDSRENCNAVIKSDSNILILGCKKTIIPESVTKIGEGAFYGCKDLTSIRIPDGVTEIDDIAFASCRSLTSVKIPSGVTRIGAAAFASCSSLTSVRIPNGVTEISRRVFAYCSSLTSVRIPDGVTEIGEEAFCKCRSLTSVRIPKQVKWIGEEAFSDCSKLTIYGEDNSYAESYAKKYRIPFILLGGIEKNAIIDEVEMRWLIEDNETKDVVIQTDDLTYTFEKGTMKLTEEKDSYDFGAEISKDYSNLKNPDFAESEFAFQVNYNYKGELPGEAKITIFAGGKWIGKRLYYYEIDADGGYKYMGRAAVAKDGMYTIKQDHCSSYIAVAKAPENLGNADGTGEITTDDALAILKYTAGLAPEGLDPALADCDGTDGITTDDALAVLKYIAGIQKEFY